jgi:hypothetical protein
VLDENGEPDARPAYFVEKREQVRVQWRAKVDLIAPEVSGENVGRPVVVKERIKDWMEKKRVLVLVDDKVSQPDRESHEQDDTESDELLPLKPLLTTQPFIHTLLWSGLCSLADAVTLSLFLRHTSAV